MQVVAMDVGCNWLGILLMTIYGISGTEFSGPFVCLFALSTLQ
jgi:hypothetical protein